MASSKTRMRQGRIRMTQAIPITTPFAMTMPMSRPMVKRIAQRARKPAMVVSELPERETKADEMAFAMASCLFDRFSFSSS